MVEKTEGAIKNGQSRDTGNTGRMKINVRENRRGNQEWTIQRHCNIGYTRRRQTKHKNTTQYVLDTTIRKRTQITQIRQNVRTHNRTTQTKAKKMSNMDPTKETAEGELRGS
jgi:hypothetical protein